MNTLRQSDNHNRDRRDDLAQAKQAFAARMMRSSTFFALAVRRTGQKDHPFHGVAPDQITYEPTYRPLDDKRVEWGVRLSAARSFQPAEARALHIAMTVFDYMALAVIDTSQMPEEQLDAADAPMMAEIRAMQDPSLSSSEIMDRTNEETAALLEQWMAGWNDIAREFKDEATLNPYSHTVALKSDDMHCDVGPRPDSDSSQWS